LADERVDVVGHSHDCEALPKDQPARSSLIVESVSLLSAVVRGSLFELSGSRAPSARADGLGRVDSVLPVCRAWPTSDAGGGGGTPPTSSSVGGGNGRNASAPSEPSRKTPSRSSVWKCTFRSIRPRTAG
jgi:hypothetical protein